MPTKRILLFSATVEDYDPDVADLLELIGAQLGRYIERRGAEDLPLGGNGPMTTETAPLLLDHHLGDVPIVATDGRETLVHVGRTSTTGVFDVAGEFDLPPEEPVVLVGEIPWELRGEDD